MTAKESALEDISRDLEKNHRCFVAFRKELNRPVQQLVREYLKKQKEHEPQDNSL